ncbi:MAG TPA: cell envelope integrity protein TolA [Chromatiaceae bacterium]|jgi:colicin import membrane protein|nr:cell envelope integrity protein TolA [Chromatiaceae bacterium]HIA07701.1 cell envelope integrity protein TolA [Chromatiaceae bacterium]HIB84323.1 cell envelope integrity protein TolA [Chromatiaceae bacterium]HIN82312.1 cell envelope integrity protein TolA [Chromatiales bacterium]HIO53929.1 cell envelope integrity protein TolA [Chromatiales bacterium]
MWQILFRTPTAFVWAVIVHAVFFGLLVVSMEWKIAPIGGEPKVDMVKATVVDAAKMAAEVEKLKQADAAKKKAEQQRHDKEKKRLADLKKKQSAEKKQLAELEAKRKAAQAKKKKQEADAAKKAKAAKVAQAEQAKKLKDLEKKQLQEKAKLEDLRKQKDALKKKRESEAARLAEVEKAREQAEQQQKLEDQRRAEVARKQAEEAKRIAAEAAAKQAIENAAQDRKLVNRYVALIRQKIERNWLRPVNSKGLSSSLRVRLIPGGEVADVRTIKSSGNPGFDRSVEVAVYKASPLDLPPDPELFGRFRELTFLFKGDE